MSSLRFILGIFSSGIILAKLLTSLLLLWLTLDWKVRKARRAFEKELVMQGMSKHDAKRISAQYTTLKNNIEKAFKQSLRGWRL